MKPIRVMLADDHKLVRAGIRSLLADIEGVDVVGEAEDGKQAIEIAKRLKPAVAFLDIAMPEMNGLEAAEIIAKECKGVVVIILSMHATEEYVMQALNVGAMGYLLKDSAPNELESALIAVTEGKTYFSPEISTHIIDSYMARVSSKKNSSHNADITN